MFLSVAVSNGNGKHYYYYEIDYFITGVILIIPCDIYKTLYIFCSSGYDFVYKIIVVGDSGVGKSQLVSRYSKNFFTSVSRPTVGIECVTHPIKMNQHSICLHIWDLSGDDKFR